MPDGSDPMQGATERAAEAYRSRYGRPPSVVVRAPGRVNLIGEHTDYNDGFVLPLALPQSTAIALEPTAESVVRASSEGFDERSFALSDPPSREDDGWAVYLHGMASLLAADGLPVGGWRGSLATDIPDGAGLSSSAALEVAAGLAFVAARSTAPDLDRSIDRDLLARIARVGMGVENDVLGLPSGIMDQLISATAIDGAAMLIDCATGIGRPVPVPPEVMVVVLDTGTRRQLVDSEFGRRRADCERAADLLGVPSLRHAPDDAPERLAAAGADEVVIRRVRHVLGENERTLAAAEALRAGDVASTGRLMGESHRSLADDYEVAGPALETIVAVATEAPGCLGARMTGGGFAGCAVALVEADALDRFEGHVLDRYRAPAAQTATAPASVLAVRPSAGASIEHVGWGTSD